MEVKQGIMQNTATFNTRVAARSVTFLNVCDVLCENPAKDIFCDSLFSIKNHSTECKEDSMKI